MAAGNYLLMCSILSLFYMTFEDCNACLSGATSCPTLATIDAGSWKSYSSSCFDSAYYLTINSIQVGQADGDVDDFSVTVMDEDNHNNFRNEQSYQYYSDLGTGSVGGTDTTCYDYTGPGSFSAGTKVYVVIKCRNLFETCNLRVNLDSICHSSNPCPGVSCNSHGYCSNGVCVCNTGYSGQNCENYDPCAVVDCSHGYCVGGQCLCYEGYSGPTCSDSCLTVTCLNGGSCRNGKCSCSGNYAGSDCSIYSLVNSVSGHTTIIITVASCLGGAVLLSLVVCGFLVLFVRSRRRRQEVITTDHELTHVPSYPEGPLISAMEQQYY